MPQLIHPDVARHEAWLRCHREWGPGLHEDGFGLSADDDVATAAGFATWVGLLQRDEDASVWTGPSAKACFYRWIVDGTEIVGGIAARVSDSAYVRRNGHIGYGLRPSARGRGLASWALGEVVRDLFDRSELRAVLLVCETANRASAATIERQGGVAEPAAAGSAVTRYVIARRP